MNDTDVGGDDFAPTYFFMGKGAKVLKYPSSRESSEGESNDNLKPRYSKLANIATKKQSAMERIQKLLDKSNDPLNEEMDQTQIPTNDFQSLECKYDDIQRRHEILLGDHEKLS